MTNMIEKVAVAICKSEKYDPYAIIGRFAEDNDFACSGKEVFRWMSYLPQAKAAIEALKRPTRSMRAAANAIYDEDEAPDYLAAYVEMINTALEET